MQGASLRVQQREREAVATRDGRAHRGDRLGRVGVRGDDRRPRPREAMRERVGAPRVHVHEDVVGEGRGGIERDQRRAGDELAGVLHPADAGAGVGVDVSARLPLVLHRGSDRVRVLADEERLVRVVRLDDSGGQAVGRDAELVGLRPRPHGRVRVDRQQRRRALKEVRAVHEEPDSRAKGGRLGQPGGGLREAGRQRRCW